MGAGRTRFVAWSLGGLAVAISALGTVFAVLEGPTAFHPFTTGGLAWGFSFAIVGGLVAARAPRNAMGWLFLVIALSQATTNATGSYVYAALANGWSVPGLRVAAWLSMWTWAPGFVTFVTLVPLLFPTGRPPSARWRPVVWLSFFAMASTVGIQAVATSSDPIYLVSNPAFEPVGLVAATMNAAMTTIVVASLASLAGMTQRFRRSRGTERQQLKWFLWAAVVAVTAMLALGVAADVDAAGPLLKLFAIPLALILPVAIGMSVIRYRLYEIDRIVRRTVTYALVTAIAFGVYAAVVVGAQALLAPVTSGSDLAVAASTLAAAGAFGPVLRRVRSAMDRRFDRSHHDAVATVEHFGQRLRDEVDLDELVAQTTAVARETLRPGSAGVWLSEEGAR
jgi:hypothetical protein